LEQVNLLIFLRKRNKSFRISIPIYVIYCLVGLILISLIIGTVSFLTYNQRLIEHKRTNILARENRLLSDKLTKIENQLTRFKQTIIELSEFDSKLRLSFAMDLIPQDVRLMGVGGLNHEDVMDEGQVDLIQTENTLAELERQAQFQKQSFAEIVTYIQQQDKVLSHTPSIWPVGGWVSSGFGYRNDPFTGRRVMHRGIDIVAPPGTPIVAAADGRVNFAGVKSGYGKTVQIDHGYGYTTFYGHCQSIRVRYGQVVRRGHVIATVGRTGKTTGYHLHYGVKVSGKWVNPRNYILNNYAVVE
jgi:murein DD-endopeptidase MepM/ murein hydrolase activator NlpD